DREQQRKGHFDLDPAALAPATDHLRDHDEIAQVSDPQNLGLVVVPLLGPEVKSFKHSGMAVQLVRNPGKTNSLSDLDVLVAQAEDTLVVPPHERADGRPHNLHVLLRHRYVSNPTASRASH